MSPEEIVEQLEQAIQLAGCDPARLQKALAPVNAWLHQQTLPPCTCGVWQGTPDNGFWHCARHRVGAGGISGYGPDIIWSFSFEPPDLVVGTSHSTGSFDPDAFQFFSTGG